MENKILELKELVLRKANIADNGNVKLGNMGSWAMLFGNYEWYIPELDVTVDGTCGEYCKGGCFNEEDVRKSPCYVAKSYVKYTKRNDDGTVGDICANECSVKLGHAYRTIAMRFFRGELLERIDKQLTNKKEKFTFVRINESGELMEGDGEFWCEEARRHPETVFYFYTKNYDEVRRLIEKDLIPSNLFILISIWHEYGIKEYREFRHHPQIKAFVLVDDEWTKEKYAEYGIEITTMCGAYDSKGKMDHNVTCDRCNKCMNRIFNLIGCYEH